MSTFSEKEMNLICIYDPGNRIGTICELRNMMDYLMLDENELKDLALGVITKLEKMTDSDYEVLSDEMTPDTFDGFADEDSACAGSFSLLWDDIDLDSEIE